MDSIGIKLIRNETDHFIVFLSVPNTSSIIIDEVYRKRRTNKVEVLLIIDLLTFEEVESVLHIIFFKVRNRTILYKKNWEICIDNFDFSKEPCSTGIHYFVISDLDYFINYHKELTYYLTRFARDFLKIGLNFKKIN
jgi:hypothetical protein